jgi:hypothetical protein
MELHHVNSAIAATLDVLTRTLRRAFRSVYAQGGSPPREYVTACSSKRVVHGFRFGMVARAAIVAGYRMGHYGGVSKASIS